MEQREIVREGSGWSGATFGMLAVLLLVIVGGIVAFTLHPWSATTDTHSTTTTVTQPGANGNVGSSSGTSGSTNGSSGQSSSNSSSTTTTH